MSHVVMEASERLKPAVDRHVCKTMLRQRKWRSVEVGISDHDLHEYFKFLNAAVVLRPSREGMPLMTTTGIFGPIRPRTKVELAPDEKGRVKEVETDCKDVSLIQELVNRAKETPQPENSVTVRGKWVSGLVGGGLPGLDPSSNTFGGTGQLLVNGSEIRFPVLDVDHPEYHLALAYYGAKLLRPREPFYLGFDKVLFGVEYDSRQPGYIRNYSMEPFGGGGLFVEHHPFPHIFMPKPNDGDTVFCESKILLGRKIGVMPSAQCDISVEGAIAFSEHSMDPEIAADPKYVFTIFRVPSDGSAIVAKPCAIHNDSYTSGRQIVYVANTRADTVAFRETSPFTNITLTDIDPPV